MTTINYGEILNAAHKAAREATEGRPDRGACGFAWVTVDGNSPLARWCRKHAPAGDNSWQVRRIYGDKGYPKGWQWWCPGEHRGQSVDAHEAGAVAFRDKLAEYGIRADCGSRLD